MWMGILFLLVCMLSVTISMHEVTMSFNVHHVEIIIMTYKAEGDGFNGDPLFQRGYTSQTFMYSYPVPKKNLAKMLLL